MDIDPVAQGLVKHHETIDIIGEATCWVRDLEEAWEKESGRSRTEVTADSAAAVYSYEIAAARPTVWEHFTIPGHRPKWQGSDAVVETVTKAGAAPAPPITACTARPRSSRRCLTGGRSIT
jgi:hypothetical protein